MNSPKPGANLPKTRRGHRRYVNATSELLLRDCFPGMIPALVIADALREKAIREGRLKARPRQRTERR
ncbi:hypothetical protein ACWC09_26120 [Streptomyces sp. NPDC001617]